MFKSFNNGISISATQDTRRPTKDQKYPVKIRVTYMGEHKYFATHQTLSVEEWDRLPSTRSPELKEIRVAIEERFNLVKHHASTLMSSKNFSLDNLAQRVKVASDKTLNNGFKARIIELKSDGRIGNSMIYDTALKSIERFAGTKISYYDITPEWLKNYEKFLLEEKKSLSSIGIQMRTLRAIINQAIRTKSIFEYDYPFGRNNYEVRTSKGNKKALTTDQIKSIAEYESQDVDAKMYRDFWLFLYLCNGMNVCDFVGLKYSNIEKNEIAFLRHKTKQTTREVKTIRVYILPKMREIIDRWGNPPTPHNYIFPILDGDEDPAEHKRKTQNITRAINHRMGIIGEEMGFGNISTQTARHSYATVLKRSGVNIAYISESLGHHSMDTTQIYLDSFGEEEREKNATILSLGFE